LPKQECDNVTNILIMPIYLDAAVLDKPTPVVEALADFSRLPFFDSIQNRDVNPDVPRLSEDILSEPLKDEGLYVQAGIHLHWELPYALTRAWQTERARRCVTSRDKFPQL